MMDLKNGKRLGKFILKIDKLQQNNYFTSYPELNNTYTLPNHCLPNLFNKEGANHSGCILNIEEYKSSFINVDQFFYKLKENYPHTVILVDPFKSLCDKKNKCKIYNERIGTSILFDTDHLTKEGSLLIKKELEILKENLSK